MNPILRNGLIVISVFVVGVTFGHFTVKAKVVEKEKIVYQEKIIENKTKVEETKKKSNKTYIKLEHILKDGSKTIETRITNSNESGSTTTDSENKTSTVAETSSKEKSTTTAQQDTIISLLVSKQVTTVGPLDYTLFVQKRLIGPIYVGGAGSTNLSFGLSLGLAF